MSKIVGLKINFGNDSAREVTNMLTIGNNKEADVYFISISDCTTHIRSWTETETRKFIEAGAIEINLNVAANREENRLVTGKLLFDKLMESKDIESFTICYEDKTEEEILIPWTDTDQNNRQQVFVSNLEGFEGILSIIIK